jgi:hydrogenase expression/formation protein HypC
MCLAVPGKVIDIDRTADPVMGRADFGGIQRRVCLAWVPEAKIGDYVIVHVGFAISRMDEAEAAKTLDVLKRAGEASDALRG